MAVTRDQIGTSVELIKNDHEMRQWQLKWYWKVAPINEAMEETDPENPGMKLKNPDQYFEGVRGVVATRNEAQALVDANVANLLENGVAGITAL